MHLEKNIYTKPKYEHIFSRFVTKKKGAKDIAPYSFLIIERKLFSFWIDEIINI